MKRILVIAAVITILTMTACSSEKNTTKRKLYKFPAIDDEAVPTEVQDVSDTEYDSSKETEQIVGSTDAYSEKIATTRESAITEAVTDTTVPNNSMESTSSEITTTQKIPNKPVVPSSPLPAPVPDTTTAAATTEASTTTEPDPVPQISVEDIMKICVHIAEGMGYTRNTAFTPENASWWNPITISSKDTKQSIERTLSEYIRFHTPDNLAAYGYDKITCFNIYAEKLEEGTYRIYFLFA